jgi:sulfatase maturation enzyme AslB (radical SAM superfamily)
MLSLNEQKIQVLHLEPTDACNAACPQCLRETDITFDKNNLHHLTVEQIKSIVDVDTIKNLDKMFMCGTYGDPAAGKHTLEIYHYFRTINPAITLGMNTNGGLRNTSWWRELGQLLNTQKDYVVFSIDGLADTNHIYRVNVDYEKVIANAQEFIRTGGNAHWEMLVFEHNQHQVEQAQQIAKELGFKWFRAKVTKRFNVAPVEFLQPPKGWINPLVTDGNIDCLALNDQSVYISARGLTYPCCWLGANTNYTLDTFKDVQQSWTTINPNDICKATCTKNAVGTSFTNQWQREIEF